MTTRERKTEKEIEKDAAREMKPKMKKCCC